MNDAKSLTRCVAPCPKQILDTRSLADRSLLYRYWSIWTSDNYARKAWRILVKAQKPDAVFFLGDLLDSGVEGRQMTVYAGRSPPLRRVNLDSNG